MAQTCVCFPGMCRGGQVVNGKTLNGSTCREAAERQPRVIKLGLMSVCERWVMKGAAREFTLTRHYHDRDDEGMPIGLAAIAAMFDRIVELERQLGEMRKHVRFDGFNYLLDVASDERNAIRIEPHVRREWQQWANKAQLLLGSGEIPVPCNLRPSHDEQTDDCSGLPWSEQC